MRNQENLETLDVAEMNPAIEEENVEEETETEVQEEKEALRETVAEIEIVETVEKIAMGEEDVEMIAET